MLSSDSQKIDEVLVRLGGKSILNCYEKGGSLICSSIWSGKYFRGRYTGNVYKICTNCLPQLFYLFYEEVDLTELI